MDGARVVVIGAGAAGILAAWRAACLGARVTLLEKTSRIATKILISGGGKCNLAHAGPLEDVLRAFRPAETRFLRPACYRFPNDRIVEMLTSRGLEVYERPDGRVFPVHQTAKDVVAILRGYLDEAGVEVRLNAPVASIEAAEGRITGVHVGPPPPAHAGYAPAAARPGYGASALLREVLAAPAEASGPRGGYLSVDALVLATGGSSYPNSGTTGDGWPWVRALGHSIARVHAALAPIYLTLDPPPTEARAGVALRDCVLRARRGGKAIAEWRGDLLFTHQGVSGPTALAISRAVAENATGVEATLEVDLRPDEPFETLREGLLAAGSGQPHRAVATWLEGHVPARLVPELLAAAGLARDAKLARLDRATRNRLTTTLKAWPLGRVRAVPLEKGEVVAGGVSLDEVDPHTMASRRTDRLYLCGEVLDVAGPVGGYNLQAAFATGYVAGESAARLLPPK